MAQPSSREAQPKPERWLGGSKEDLREFPEDYEQWSRREKPATSR